MEELFSENTLRTMFEMNRELSEISNEVIENHFELLQSVGCTQSQILNIIGSNSTYLSKPTYEIINLINYLKEKGFRTLNILFDSNPYILSLEPFEIDNYIKKREQSGELIEDIIEDLDSNTELFFEM